MKGSKTVKLQLSEFGTHLGMEKGAYVLKDSRGRVERYPVSEDRLGEVCLMSGNNVSTGTLVHLAIWGVDTLILNRNGRPVGTIRSLFNDCNVETRLAQYRATESEKGMQIAKAVVQKRIESQNLLLRKYGLRQHDCLRIREKIEQTEAKNLKALRRRLLPLEGVASESYFSQLFLLFPKDIRTSADRRTYQAFDFLNNILNYCYTLLRWKVYASLTRAKLEPYLGFLHSEQYGKPSLVCDIMEIYRSNIDDFLLEYSKDNIKLRDFKAQYERFPPNRFGKREYLSESKLLDLKRAFYSFMESKVAVPRIRVGSWQTFETLISEECLLLAKYLRGEKEHWQPRLVPP